MQSSSSSLFSCNYLKMVIEFVTWLNPNRFLDNQVIPEVYNEEAFNGNRIIYIISSKGYHYKVTLETPREGLWYLSGPKWKEFCERSLNKNVALLNFIEEWDDTFYVIGYYRNGNEVGGYERRRDTFEWFMTRVLPDPAITKVEVLSQDPGTHKYMLLGDTWSRLIEDIGLESGMIYVFTKNQDKRLWLDAFNNDGSMFTDVNFKGASTLRRSGLKLTYFEQQDDRMLHVCQWPFHVDHFREGDQIFYKSYASIQDKNRLAIPAKFLKNHPMHTYFKAHIIHKDYKVFMTVRMEKHMETPDRKNHVNMHGQWRSLALFCNFQYSKMISFRYMSLGEYLDPEDGEVGEFPIFHIC